MAEIFSYPKIAGTSRVRFIASESKEDEITAGFADSAPILTSLLLLEDLLDAQEASEAFASEERYPYDQVREELKL